VPRFLPPPCLVLPLCRPTTRVPQSFFLSFFLSVFSCLSSPAPAPNLLWQFQHQVFFLGPLDRSFFFATYPESLFLQSALIPPAFGNTVGCFPFSCGGYPRFLPPAVGIFFLNTRPSVPLLKTVHKVFFATFGNGLSFFDPLQSALCSVAFFWPALGPGRIGCPMRGLRPVGTG